MTAEEGMKVTTWFKTIKSNMSHSVISNNKMIILLFVASKWIFLFLIGYGDVDLSTQKKGGKLQFCWNLIRP